MHSVEKRGVCLVVIDGWGLSTANVDGDAIAMAQTPIMDELQSKSCVPLLAHGKAVGLPAGLMGNSEVGHLNIGAGRVVYQDIVRIDQMIETDSLSQCPALCDTISNASRVHLVGLVSDGGVHSHLNHLKALLKTLANCDKSVWIHAITDGRDTAPRSAAKYLAELEQYCGEVGVGQLATIQGRFYAMDRDKRAERTELAWNALTQGKGQAISDWASAIATRYARDETDEFFTPMILAEDGTIKSGDAVVLFNYRSDRMRQLAALFDDNPDLYVCSMTQYKADFKMPVISPPQSMNNVLAEHLSQLGKQQLHVAETEKYAHVTFFFNGGVEKCFPGEDRRLVASPKVSTYDLQPAMSVHQVASEVCIGLSQHQYDLVMCNLAPPDMVGHTGKLAETIRAVEATDEAIGKILAACQEHHYALLITADHGNAECMLDELGGPHTAHTCAPVPLILANDPRTLEARPDAALCDVAPTVLSLLRLPQPTEMTGRSLISH